MVLYNLQHITLIGINKTKQKRLQKIPKVARKKNEKQKTLPIYAEHSSAFFIHTP